MPNMRSVGIMLCIADGLASGTAPAAVVLVDLVQVSGWSHHWLSQTHNCLAAHGLLASWPSYLASQPRHLASPASCSDQACLYILHIRIVQLICVFSPAGHADQMLLFGWRIPFLISIISASAALILRLHMPEPHEFVQDRKAIIENNQVKTLAAAYHMCCCLPVMASHSDDG
jgi:hypothetical protein